MFWKQNSPMLWMKPIRRHFSAHLLFAAQGLTSPVVFGNNPWRNKSKGKVELSPLPGFLWSKLNATSRQKGPRLAAWFTIHNRWPSRSPSGEKEYAMHILAKMQTWDSIRVQMQTANMRPCYSSARAKADQVSRHFSCFDKELNWHFVGHCWVRAHGVRAGVEPTSCDPGSAPSSPLVQSTRRDESGTEGDTLFFFPHILESIQEKSRAGWWKAEASVPILSTRLGKSEKPQSFEQLFMAYEHFSNGFSESLMQRTKL